VHRPTASAQQPIVCPRAASPLDRPCADAFARPQLRDANEQSIGPLVWPSVHWQSGHLLSHALGARRSYGARKPLVVSTLKSSHSSRLRAISPARHTPTTPTRPVAPPLPSLRPPPHSNWPLLVSGGAQEAPRRQSLGSYEQMKARQCNMVHALPVSMQPTQCSRASAPLLCSGSANKAASSCPRASLWCN